MGKFCHMATSRSSSRKYRKNQLKSASNIELVLTHVVLELGVLGIARKLLVSSNFLLKYFQKKILFRGFPNPNDHILVAWNFKG